MIFEQIAREGKPAPIPAAERRGDDPATAAVEAHAPAASGADSEHDTGWAKRRRRRRVRSNISVGEILDRTQSAGFGFVLAFLALCAMPIPGASVPFGLAIVFGALQMLIGMKRPWMPRAMRRYRLSIARLEWIGDRLTRWTRGLEKLVRPRFEMLTRGVFWFLCGLGVLLMALGLALPLPIPYSNVIFAIPLITYAIGLLESDGLLLMIAHSIVVVDLTLAVRYGGLIVQKAQDFLSWIVSFF